jgi:proteasome accessory factor C
MSRDVAQKIRRLLFIVPYVAKHRDGVSVDSLAQLLGCDRDELLADLDLLSQVGPPDGDPGEYLLVSVEHGRVFVDLAHRLTRPLRLTPAEGCSLLLGIRAMRESGIAPFDSAMQSAETKLLAAMGRDAEEAESLAIGTVMAEPHGGVASHLGPLVTSTRLHQQVEIDYVSASRHQSERRTIDPYGIVHHAGEWYVVGHCHARGDVRTFRVDRIAALQVTEVRFTAPDNFDLESYRRDRLYVPSADAVTVRIHLEPLAVTRIGANWPVGDVTTNADGSAEFVMDCEGFEWVTGWILGFGRHAWITGPASARAAMKDRLQRTQQQMLR